MTATLELGWATPRAWAEAALAEPLALLSDHAYCELGAAAAAQGLIARRPGDVELVERLGAHASDELRHFRQVHRPGFFHAQFQILLDLGVVLGHLHPSLGGSHVEEQLPDGDPDLTAEKRIARPRRQPVDTTVPLHAPRRA